MHSQDELDPIEVAKDIFDNLVEIQKEHGIAAEVFAYFIKYIAAGKSEYPAFREACYMWDV